MLVFFFAYPVIAVALYVAWLSWLEGHGFMDSLALRRMDATQRIPTLVRWSAVMVYGEATGSIAVMVFLDALGGAWRSVLDIVAPASLLMFMLTLLALWRKAWVYRQTHREAQDQRKYLATQVRR